MNENNGMCFFVNFCARYDLRSSWVTDEQEHSVLSKSKYERCLNNFKIYFKIFQLEINCVQ